MWKIMGRRLIHQINFFFMGGFYGNIVYQHHLLSWWSDFSFISAASDFILQHLVGLLRFWILYRIVVHLVLFLYSLG